MSISRIAAATHKGRDNEIMPERALASALHGQVLRSAALNRKHIPLIGILPGRQPHRVIIDDRAGQVIVRERYAALGLKPYGGFINPDIVPVESGGKVTDYQVVYKTDYLEQQLEYGRKYRTL